MDGLLLMGLGNWELLSVSGFWIIVEILYKPDDVGSVEMLFTGIIGPSLNLKFFSLNEFFCVVSNNLI